jgi:urease accessory protein UreF
MEIRLGQIVYFWSKKPQNRLVLTAPKNRTLPNSRQHPYEAQLDALEGLMCADLMAAALGTATLSSTTDLSVLLEQYRTTILEPIEMPVIAQAQRLASRGRTNELIALDQEFLGNHPEWLQLSPTSKRFGLDFLSRLHPLQDERVVQRMLKAAQNGKIPGHHLIVFGLTMAVFSIAPRQGLADYAQSALNALIATKAGKLKLTQDDRNTLFARSQSRLPEAIDRMVA